MKNILISGLFNMETTLQIKGFPIDYFPIDYPFFGINTSVSGVSANIAKAEITQLFASCKIGVSQAAAGFIGEEELEKMFVNIHFEYRKISMPVPC
jgi:hypothetical protein